MDALALLQTTAAAYRALKSLTIEMRITQASYQEGTSHQHRVRAYYAAPDRYRLDQVGRRGDVTVSVGLEALFYWGRMKQVRRQTLMNEGHIRGMFQPEFPAVNSYLFPRIADNVVQVRELAGSDIVLQVTYATTLPDYLISYGPITFWIDPQTSLVAALEFETFQRRPMEDEVEVAKHRMEVIECSLNEGVDAAMFEFEPPSGTLAGFEYGGGGGTSSSVRADGTRFEHRSSSTWIGTTLVESSAMRIDGLRLEFERRHIFSDDKRELRIAETITGPAGVSRFEHTIPLHPESE